MFKRPDLTQISRLDEVGSDLNVLKRHYKSYIRIIDRVMEIKSADHYGDLGGSEIPTRIVDGEDDGINIRPPLAQERPHIGIDPGLAARVRFERLKDMITLYALSEVNDYLDKKQMLVDMASLRSLE